MKRIIRVFPRKTSFTPKDEYSFVGDPPMIRPEADEVHISVTFTWDIKEGFRLADAWKPYCPVVSIGGPALNSIANGFEPNVYIRQGVVFTSRGCNNQCPWCLVPKREGGLREIEIHEGNIIQDNNLLQCSRLHLDKVFNMLKKQRTIQFTGGLDSRLITDDIADEIRDLKINQLFLASDTKEAIKPLRKAIKKLRMSRHKIRCYVLLKFNPFETLSDATERMHLIWEAGATPFAQLYQPPDEYIRYPREWLLFARTWSRPAAIYAEMKSLTNKSTGGREMVVKKNWKYCPLCHGDYPPSHWHFKKKGNSQSK